jgi:hypothetical protein
MLESRWMLTMDAPGSRSGLARCQSAGASDGHLSCAENEVRSR